MPDIQHDFFIKVNPEKVFDGVTRSQGLDAWWTETSSGQPALQEEYALGFGPGYDWKAVVRKCQPPHSFELEMAEADADWTGTRVGFRIHASGEGSQVQFYHTGWPQVNEHYRISAMYLRILKLNLENGLSVPYKDRLEV